MCGRVAGGIEIEKKSDLLRGNHLCLDACPAGSAPGPLQWQREGFARFGLRGKRSTFARSGADFAAGAILRQGQVQIFVAGAALWQGQVQIPWRAQHFGKVRH